VRIVLHFLYQRIGPAFFFCKVDGFGFADRKQGSFSGREKSGEHKQDEQNHKLIK
jgi:hypothetical protein